MAKKAQLTIKRGDEVTRRLYIPISIYEPGSILGFAAKPIPDNDITDSAAVISKEFDDDNVALTASHAVYTMLFESSDTYDIEFLNGATENLYAGEFQYKKPSAGPISWPGNNQYIDVIVYADVRREVP